MFVASCEVCHMFSLSVSTLALQGQSLYADSLALPTCSCDANTPILPLNIWMLPKYGFVLKGFSLPGIVSLFVTIGIHFSISKIESRCGHSSIAHVHLRRKHFNWDFEYLEATEIRSRAKDRFEAC